MQSGFISDQDCTNQINPEEKRKYKNKGLLVGFFAGEVLGLLIAYALYPKAFDASTILPFVLVWHGVLVVCMAIGHWAGEEFYKETLQQKKNFA